MLYKNWGNNDSPYSLNVMVKYHEHDKHRITAQM